MDCKEWGHLPRGGGLWDQPAGIMERMNAHMNVYYAVTRFKAAQDKGDFMKRYPELWRIYNEVQRLLHGDQ